MARKEGAIKRRIELYVLVIGTVALAVLLTVPRGERGERLPADWETDWQTFPADSWHTGRSAEVPNDSMFTRLPRTHHAPVRESTRARAEQLLAEHSFLELALEELSTYTDRAAFDSLPAFTNTDSVAYHPYLIRGVAYNEHTGGFIVAQSGDWLLVHHGSLGRSSVPMKRLPLVVLLRKKPVRVVVTAGMAQ